MIGNRSRPVRWEAVGKGPAHGHLASGPPNPKADGRRRPLGIPVIADRALQAVAHKHDRPQLPRDRRPYARPAETQSSSPERQQLLTTSQRFPG